MGGAFYAKSSVELDVEAHGEAAPGAAGAMAVGGGGGGGGGRARRRCCAVPGEGGATVFVRPGGRARTLRVRPGPSRVRARTHTRTRRSAAGGEEET